MKRQRERTLEDPAGGGKVALVAVRAEQLERERADLGLDPLQAVAVEALGDTTVGGAAAGLAGDAAAVAPTRPIAMGPFIAACAAAFGKEDRGLVELRA